MKMPKIKVLCINEHAKLPTQATDRAQCIDFYAAEDVEILPGETKLVDLGVKLVLPEGYGLEFRERSGLATKGIIIGAGIIDEDYHGSLKAVVRYLNGKFREKPAHVVSPIERSPDHRPFNITKGDKIVQAELVRRIPITIDEVNPEEFENLTDDSQRGEKGFGSSDEQENQGG